MISTAWLDQWPCWVETAHSALMSLSSVWPSPVFKDSPICLVNHKQTVFQIWWCSTLSALLLMFSHVQTVACCSSVRFPWALLLSCDDEYMDPFLQGLLTFSSLPKCSPSCMLWKIILFAVIPGTSTSAGSVPTHWLFLSSSSIDLLRLTIKLKKKKIGPINPHNKCVIVSMWTVHSCNYTFNLARF